MYDIAARYIINSPDEILADDIEFTKRLRDASWYCSDCLRDVPGLPRGFENKAYEICQHISGLEHITMEEIEALGRKLAKYNKTIPRRGGILLNENMDKILLAYNREGDFASFPGGKLNAKESDEACALREIYEECGYDAKPTFHPKHMFRRQTQLSRMYYLVWPVPEKQGFAPRVGNEVGKIRWVKLTEFLHPTAHRAWDNLRDDLSGLQKFIERVKSSRTQLQAELERRQRQMLRAQDDTTSGASPPAASGAAAAVAAPMLLSAAPAGFHHFMIPPSGAVPMGIPPAPGLTSAAMPPAAATAATAASTARVWAHADALRATRLSSPTGHFDLSKLMLKQ